MTRALVYVAPQQCELRPIDPAATASAISPESERVSVRTLWSGVSRGTERLVYEGRVPVSEHAVMRAPLQVGEFPFPVAYGYAAVGRVEEGPTKLCGECVFVLAPHHERFIAPTDLAVPVPHDVPPRRAVLAANLETALNGAWDGAAGPGDRIAIVGAGVLGGLLAALLGALPGAEVTLIDPLEERRDLARALGVAYAAPDQAAATVADADLVYHTSATAEGLDLALALAGVEARVVEMSWFGDRRPTPLLGGAFHSRRLTLVSSQVGQVAPSRRPRWPHRRRLAMALSLLRDPRFDALITDEVAFAHLPEAMPRVLAREAKGLATVVRYEAAAEEPAPDAGAAPDQGAPPV